MSSTAAPALSVGDVMTAADVAELLNIRRSTIEDWARRGIIPSHKLGRHRRFLREEIEAWVRDTGREGS